jgi:transposase-like protein
VAALAREHGISANVLDRWLKEHRVGIAWIHNN